MSTVPAIVCGYDLHLYCTCNKCNTTPGWRQWHGGMGKFAHPKKSGAFREARQAGWKISEKNDTAFAPKHSRK